MSNIGDVYQIKLSARYLGVQTLNVYYYKLIDAETGATDVGVAWHNQVEPSLLQIVTPGFALIQREVVNLNDLSDYDVHAYDPSVTKGDRAGENAPPFVTWSFRFYRSTKECRNGSKRYAGVSEADMQDGAAIGSIIPRLTIHAASLQDELAAGLTPAALKPVIHRSIGPLPGQYDTFDIRDVGFVGIGTQNTRKFGRGS